MNTGMPSQLWAFIPLAVSLDPAPRVCSALGSSVGSDGEVSVAAFVEQLSDAGLITEPGARFASGGMVDEAGVDEGIPILAVSLAGEQDRPQAPVGRPSAHRLSRRGGRFVRAHPEALEPRADNTATPASVCRPCSVIRRFVRGRSGPSTPSWQRISTL